MTHHIARAAFIATVAFLTACGDGGSSTAPAPEPTLDRAEAQELLSVIFGSVGSGNPDLRTVQLSVAGTSAPKAPTAALALAGMDSVIYNCSLGGSVVSRLVSLTETPTTQDATVEIVHRTCVERGFSAPRWTFIGDPSLRISMTWTKEALSVSTPWRMSARFTGAVRYSDGTHSGRCPMDATLETIARIDAAGTMTSTVTFKGLVCGVRVNDP